MFVCDVALIIYMQSEKVVLQMCLSFYTVTARLYKHGLLALTSEKVALLCYKFDFDNAHCHCTEQGFNYILVLSYVFRAEQVYF
jgi:hypothetical protein